MAKKCKQCGKKFTPFNSTQVVCNYICAVAFNKEKEVEKRFKLLKHALKESDAIPLLLKTAKLLCQKWARLRDKDLPCISCGCTTAAQWHGGHLFKAELYPNVELEEINVNKQCGQCNYFLDGNELNYVQGFVKKYGDQALKDLRLKAEENKRFKKWERWELKEKIDYYKTKIKEYENT